MMRGIVLKKKRSCSGEAAGAESGELSPAELCPLCDRPLGTVRVERHHLIPRTAGGRRWVRLHRICHKKIHSLFTERELAREYASIEALRAHPEIIRFIRWLRGKPPEFYAPTREARSKRRRRGCF